MKKNIIKISLISLITILLITNVSLGFGLGDLKGNTSNLTEVQTVGNNSLKVLGIIGSAAALIFMIILGIKYMMGSTEERAVYKRTLLPYLIGAIFVFGASVIATFIYNMFN